MVGVFDGRDTPTRTTSGVFEPFDVLAVIMDHRVIQRVDTLDIFRIQGVLRADPSRGGGAEIG